MRKEEFLERLTRELSDRDIPDVLDIIEEYERHFEFKLADGFSEEEIVAKLGNPIQLAGQFYVQDEHKQRMRNSALTVIGLYLNRVGAGAFFAILVIWGVIMAVFSIGCLAVSVGLFARIAPLSLIVPMPGVSAIIFGVTLTSLAVLVATSTIYYMAFVRQLMRVYNRFHKNILASIKGRPTLPSLAVSPQFQPRFRRKLRRVIVASLSVFVTLFILGMTVSIFSSGSLSFWHTWGWFGFTA